MADRDTLLDRMTERIIAIREASGDAWPVAIDRKVGEVEAIADPDWRGGYWIELLRLVGERTGDWGHYLEGASRLRKLNPLLARRSILNGPAFYYGAARLYATLSDRNSRTAALAAAYGIRTLADPDDGSLPLHGRQDQTIGVDLALLLDWWALEETGDATFLDGAERVLAHVIRSVQSNKSSAKDPWAPMAAVRALLRGWEAIGEPRYVEAALPLFRHATAAIEGAKSGETDNRDLQSQSLFEAAATLEALARLAVIDPAVDEVKPFVDALPELVDRLISATTPADGEDHRPAGLLLGPPKARAKVPIAAQYCLFAALHCLDTGELPC